MYKFELYFDESGNFEEHALFENKLIARKEAPQKGASQLVGVLAAAGTFSVAHAERVLSEAHAKAGMVLGKKMHATELVRDGRQEEYAVLLDEFLKQLGNSKLQPARMTNSPRIGFGDKVATYTSMVAEFVVRIFEELTSQYGNTKLELKIVAARVRLNGQEKHAPQIFINEQEYLNRLNEQIAFAAVRRGIAHNRINWSISSFIFGSGLSDRQLQVCDLLSNASYRNFRNCSSAQKQQLKELLGEFDFTLNRSDVLDEISSHRQDNTLSHAIQTIAENWDRTELDQRVLNEIRESCDSIVTQLSALPSSARNLHLRQLSDWAGEFLMLRDLDLADRTLAWLDKYIAAPLVGRMKDPAAEDIFWFPFRIWMLRLGCSNHNGNLNTARPLVNELERTSALLSNSWEHGSLVIEALNLQAVHLIDCAEYDKASQRMKAVCGFYENMSVLMSDALPGIFPERVHSENAGKALGTWLQSEMYAGLSDAARLDFARTLSERAIAEFFVDDDKKRQYQYRCQLETIAGQLGEARKWLAESLGLSDAGHTEIASRIKGMHGAAQGFAMLHWSRIGMEAGRLAAKGELTAFIKAFTDTALDNTPWVTDTDMDYPAHGIRRHLLVAMAAASCGKDARVMAARLAKLNTAGKEVLSMVQMAGLLEYAALLCAGSPSDARRLFTEAHGDKKGLNEQLDGLVKQTAMFPKMHELMLLMQAGAKRCAAADWQKDCGLREACRLVGL